MLHDINVGLLKHKEGYILKSVEGVMKGKNEVRFYEELQNDDSLKKLRELVPSYFGTVTVKINSKGWYIDLLQQYNVLASKTFLLCICINKHYLTIIYCIFSLV